MDVLGQFALVFASVWAACVALAVGFDRRHREQTPAATTPWAYTILAAFLVGPIFGFAAAFTVAA